MHQIEDKSAVNVKRRFIVSLILLIAGIIYAISPIDLIPDVLVPIGWVDDLGVLLVSFLYSWASYRKLKKERNNAIENTQ